VLACARNVGAPGPVGFARHTLQTKRRIQRNSQNFFSGGRIYPATVWSPVDILACARDMRPTGSIDVTVYALPITGCAQRNSDNRFAVIESIQRYSHVVSAFCANIASLKVMPSKNTSSEINFLIS
jgi:hypothetical protein